MKPEKVANNARVFTPADTAMGASNMQAANAQKTNIVFILMDNLGWDDYREKLQR